MKFQSIPSGTAQCNPLPVARDSTEPSAHMKPKITVTQLSNFIGETNRIRRIAIVRNAKFAAHHTGRADQTLRMWLQFLLSQPSFGGHELDKWIMKLEHRIRHSFGSDKLLLQNDLIIAYAYRGLFARRFSKYEFGTPTHISNTISGVSIEAYLDAVISDGCEKSNHEGGMMMLISHPEKIRNLRSHYRRVTSLLHLLLLEKSVMTSPRLCILVDLTTAMVARASPTNRKFQEKAKIACSEIAYIWEKL